MMKRMFCILFCILTAISLVNIALAAEDGYMTFQPYGIYKTDAPLDVIPVTYEAWVRIPEGRTGASDVVISNSNSYYISFIKMYSSHLKSKGPRKLLLNLLARLHLFRKIQISKL